MSLRRHFATAFALMLAGPLASAALAQNNLPLGYKWLQAVKDKDGSKLYKISTENRGAMNSAVLDYQSDGEGAIHIAVRQDNKLFVDFMLGLGASPNLISDKAGESPLTLAVGADQPDLELMTTLLRYHARIDGPNRAGETALTKAVANHKTEAVAFLLKQGADPDKGDYSGKSARAYAADPRYPAIAKLLAEAPKRTARPVSGPKLN